METVVLKPLRHQGQECIGIYCIQNATLNHYIQKQGGAKWSRTQKCWYVPYTQKNYKLLAKALSGKAILQTEALKEYLLEKKKNKPVPAVTDQNKPVAKQEIKKTPAAQSKPIHTLSNENNEALQKFTRQLVLKAYSASTIRTYTNELMQFLNTLKDKPASEFSVQQIKDYLQYCFTTLKLSEATLHSRINALKFYYEQVLKKEKFFLEIPRPKKHNQLPKVLSENEIGRMFNAIGNIKHKAILFAAYSAGLRVSEVINLKIKDVDSDRMQLFIEKAKGEKRPLRGFKYFIT